MLTLDILFRRVVTAIRTALPGASTASRLRRRLNASWRKVPPSQQPSAYAQHMQTRQQLWQIHLSQKVAPKIIDWLHAAVTSEYFVNALCAIIWVWFWVQFFSSLAGGPR